MHKSNRIFLVGSMGAGKSAVGRQLARLLRYAFTDTDHEIEDHAGVDISFIFDKEGEPGFRVRETKALKALAQRRRIVIATGGGCVVTQANRAIMRERGTVVYLSASVEQLFRRVRYGTHRPLLLTDNPRQALADIVAARAPLYEALADLTVDTNGRRVRAVAQEIQRRLQDPQQDRLNRAKH